MLKRKPTASRKRPGSLPVKAQAFLAAYALTASITEAAASVGIGRHTHYDWMKSEAYRTAFAEAEIQAAGVLEDAAVERATKGVFEPNVWQGRFAYPQIWDEEKKRFVDEPGSQPIGIYRKSDGVLLALLRGRLPDKYGAKSAVEVTGANGGPVEVSLADVIRDRRSTREGKKK